MKFPKLLHVVVEEPEHDDPYLIALNDGVASLDKPQRVAIYQLVRVGRVEVTKKFVEK